jgi:BT1 family
MRRRALPAVPGNWLPGNHGIQDIEACRRHSRFCHYGVDRLEDLAQPDLLDLPILHLLKNELRVSESQMAMLFGIGALAWYLKPLAGLLVDNFALFGTHRRYYLSLIISALLTAALWLFLGIASSSYFLLLVVVVAMQSMLIIGSTVLGGFLVERGKLLKGRRTTSLLPNIC